MNKGSKKNELTEIDVNNLDEENIIEFLNKDLDLIKKIKNPSLRIQKIIVRIDINYFSYILEPDINVVEYVARLKPSLLRDEMFDIESVQKILMSKNPRYARKFTKMSNNIKQRVAEDIPSLLNYKNEENLQKSAFISNCLSIKYFKDCCLLDSKEIMYRCPGASCMYIDTIDKNTVSKYIECIAPIFYGKIKEYTRDIVKYILNYNTTGARYLSYDKMLEICDIEDILSDFYYPKLRGFLYRAPYNLVKNALIKYPQLCNIVEFKNEGEILSAINSNEEIIKKIKWVPESILINISEDLYSKIKYFGEVSKETQRKLLSQDVGYAGKIKNLDLDLVKQFCVYDSSIIRYLRFVDDELITYGLISGVIEANEFVGIDKNKLTTMIFLSKELKRRG